MSETGREPFLRNERAPHTCDSVAPARARPVKTSSRWRCKRQERFPKTTREIRDESFRETAADPRQGYRGHDFSRRSRASPHDVASGTTWSRRVAASARRTRSGPKRLAGCSARFPSLVRRRATNASCTLLDSRRTSNVRVCTINARRMTTCFSRRKSDFPGFDRCTLTRVYGSVSFDTSDAGRGGTVLVTVCGDAFRRFLLENDIREKNRIINRLSSPPPPHRPNAASLIR